MVDDHVRPVQLILFVVADAQLLARKHWDPQPASLPVLVNLSFILTCAHGGPVDEASAGVVEKVVGSWWPVDSSSETFEREFECWDRKEILYLLVNIDGD